VARGLSRVPTAPPCSASSIYPAGPYSKKGTEHDRRYLDSYVRATLPDVGDAVSLALA